MKILEINNISVVSEKGKKILRNVSFGVEKGSTHVILGPNGSGKSTLAYTIMGIRNFKTISGKINFLGKDITHLSPTKRAKMGITLAFQEPVYFEGIKVKDFLKIGREEASKNDLSESLLTVGLSPEKFLEREMNNSLSGGERKRIELASVIVMKPKLMILDEPDSGLDIVIYREFCNILERIKKKTKATIIFITHRVCTEFKTNKASFLYKGNLLMTGDFRKVMKKYYETIKQGE